MDRYAAIESYQYRIKQLEDRRELVLSTLKDKDVHRNCKDMVLKDVADIDIEIAIYIDFIETISNLEI